MAETFNIQLESDLSEFTGTVTDGGDLSWSANAALAGTDGGMQCVIDDTTAIYGYINYSQLSSGVYGYRFYVDPNGLTMANSNNFRLMMISTQGVNMRSTVELYYSSGYYVRAGVYDDSSVMQYTSYYAISDTSHYIEVLINYASGAAASDGTLDLWIDDVHQEQVTGVDLYDRTQPDQAILGPVFGLDAGTSGTLYLDEFVLRDDDTKIGAVGGSSPPDPPPSGGTSDWWDGTWGIPPGARGYCGYWVGMCSPNYARGGRWWETSLQYPKATGTSTMQYKAWCAQLQANGCNLIRAGLFGQNSPYGNGYHSFEPPPYGTYNTWNTVLDPTDMAAYNAAQGTAKTYNGNWSGSNIERLINAAGSYDVKLTFAFFFHGEFLDSWRYHAWNSSNYFITGVACGTSNQGFISNAYEIFSNSTAIAAAKARISDAISQIGTSSTVAAWELCVEQSWMHDPSFFNTTWSASHINTIRTVITPWVEAMCGEIGSADPHDRPIMTDNLRIPPSGGWDSDPDNYWNVINEPLIADDRIKFVGVSGYTNGDYDEAVRRFRMAQEYIGTARCAFIYEYEGTDNSHPPLAYEVAPYRPSKAIQWIGVVGEKWGYGSNRWFGLTEIGPNYWSTGCEADPGLADIAGVSEIYASYVNWNAHRQNWSQRHAQCSSAGLDSVVASGNSQYVTFFAKWTSGGTKTLNISGMTNGAYTLQLFNWVTGALASETDVTVTTGTAVLSINADTDENRVVGYLATNTITATGSATATRNLSVTTDVTVTYATQPPIPTPETVTAADESTRYELRIRGANGSEVARLGTGGADPNRYHVGPFEYMKHVNSPGGMTLRLSGGHPALDLLEENGQVEVWRNAGAGWYRDFTAIWTDDYDYDYHEEPLFTGYAPGHLVILDWANVAWAAGSANRSKFSAVRAETIGKTLVQYNVTSSAGTANGRDLDWRGPFTVTLESDRGQGAALDVSCARQPLLETLQEVATSGGGDFDLIRSTTNPKSFQFRWYNGQRGENRTSTVRFSVELANMKNVTYRHRGSKATSAAIVGGQGEGSGRDIEIRLASEDSSTRHREAFVNATEIDKGETDALRDKGDRYLGDHGDTEVFAFDVAQTPSSKYGVHYCVSGALGDLVTVVRPDNAEEQTHKIVQVTVAVGIDGSDAITVGTEEQ